MAAQLSDLLQSARPTFDPATGVTVPDAPSVRETVAAAFVKVFRTDAEEEDLVTTPGTPGGQLVDLLTAEIVARNSEIAYIVNQISPMTAQSKNLDKLAQLYMIERKLSEPTVVTCTCRGLRGTVIPFGAIVQDSQGNQLRQNTASGLTIGTDGTVTGPFATVEHGPIEITPHSVTKIVTVIAGWDSIDNDAAGATGRDQEKDGEYYTRMKDSHAINGRAYLASIEANIAALDGVLDVRVLENYTGSPQQQYSVTLKPHSIGVFVVGGEDEAIADVLMRRKDVGCDMNGDTYVTCRDGEHHNAKYTYRIVRPTSTPFKVRIHFFDDHMATEYETAVRKAVVDDFLGGGQYQNSRVGLAMTVPALRFYKAAAGASVSAIKAIEIALGDGDWTDAVDVPADVEPTLDEDAIELVYGGA